VVACGRSIAASFNGYWFPAICPGRTSSCRSAAPFRGCPSRACRSACASPNRFAVVDHLLASLCSSAPPVLIKRERAPAVMPRPFRGRRRTGGNATSLQSAPIPSVPILRDLVSASSHDHAQLVPNRSASTLARLRSLRICRRGCIHGAFDIARHGRQILRKPREQLALGLVGGQPADEKAIVGVIA